MGWVVWVLLVCPATSALQITNVEREEAGRTPDETEDDFVTYQWGHFALEDLVVKF